MKKRIALSLVLVMALSLFVGCAPTETTQDTTNESAEKTDTTTESTEKTGDDSDTDETEVRYLRWPLYHAFNDTMSGFIPTTNDNYLKLVLDPLFLYDTENREFVPVVAEGMDVSDDGLVYTVTLRDAYFTDGTKITADDVVFTFNYHMFGGSVRAGFLSSIQGYDEAADGTADTLAGVQAVDEKTVTFTLKDVDSTFVDMVLANTTFAILPSAAFEGMSWVEVSENDEYWSKPYGYGAYYIEETNYPNYVTLKSNKDYFAPAGIENVLMISYADMESANAAMLAGDLDMWNGANSAEIDNMSAQNPDVQKFTADALYYRGLWCNCSGEAGDGQYNSGMTNPKIRRALNMLIDKEQVAMLFGDLAVPLTTNINPNTPNYNSDIPLFKRNVEEAVEILNEEGFDFDSTIRIYAYYTDQATVDFLDLLVQNFADAGVQAEYYIDRENNASISEAANYDMAYMGAGVTFAMLAYNFIPSQTTPGFTDEQQASYGDLIDQWRSALDEATQKELLDEIQYLGMEDMAIIPLYCMNTVAAYNTANFAGFTMYASNYNTNAYMNTAAWSLVE